MRSRLPRTVAVIALALCLIGCDSTVMPRDRVPLLTSGTETLDANGDRVVGCVLMGVVGELMDPDSGTALQRGPDLHPVMWPKGFSGRRIGPEIEVLDQDDNLVAVTGRTYEVLYTEVGWGTERNERISACGEVRPA